MITIEYTIPKKINLAMGTTVVDKHSLEAILEELKKHKLISSSGGEWVRLTELAGGDYFLSKIHVIAQNDEHLALEFIYLESGTHEEFVDTRFYQLKTK